MSKSQSEPSVESYLFCSAMYSTHSTTTGTLLLICLPAGQIAELATAGNEGVNYGHYAVIQLAEG